MNKEKIAESLKEIARWLEVKGENPFKIRSYSNAARAVETFSGDLPREPEALKAIPGIGEALAAKICELLTTGRLEFLEKLRSKFPKELSGLFELQGLGGKRIHALYYQLGIDSIESLEKACRDGSVAALPGFGEKTAANLLEAIALKKKSAGYFLLAEAAELAETILESLRSVPSAGRVEVAGSYRRRKPVVRDLDFLVATREPARVIENFVQHPAFERVLARGDTKASAIAHNGMQCDLRAVTPDEYPFALNYFTGSKEHNIRIRSRARERGWTLNEYRLAAEEPTATLPPEAREESDIYRALGLDFIPPELRENLGEIEAAEAGRLPRLLEWSNLRGTFHNHTTASDGRATLEEMARAAAELGLDYLGIADHSRSSVQANGLDARRLKEQLNRLRELDAQLDGSPHLLAGIECDILKDGSLDFPDEVLAELDYVVISVHSAFSLSEAEMTRRVIRAMEHPLATILAHPTGRLLLHREPYAINIPAVLEAAAATGTFIELNAHPHRLDLDWSWWPLAKKLGVQCAINPDAHCIEDLAHLFLGVDIARKGWLEAQNVVNTLPFSRLKNLLLR